MFTVEEHSMPTGLEAKRAALQRELAQVEWDIHQTEQAQARLEEQIKFLEQGQHRAA
jgi:hypothetical protein